MEHLQWMYLPWTQILDLVNVISQQALAMHTAVVTKIVGKTSWILGTKKFAPKITSDNYSDHPRNVLTPDRSCILMSKME